MASDEAKVLHELEEMYVLGHNDEVSYVAKKRFKDAIKDRMGQWITDIYGFLGARSYNLFEGDEKNPRQYEKFLVGVRHNDDYPKDNEAFEYIIMGHYNGERGDMTSRRNAFLRVTEDYIEAFGKKIAWNDMSFDAFRAGVIDLYINLLQRNPESEAVIEEWRRNSAGNLDFVRTHIKLSDEYKAKHP